jgi:hypothetical protein
MTLPKIELPIYDLRIPSTQKEIQVRPFKVKEEKLLLMAAEAEDTNEVVNVTKQILNNCILTEGVEVDKLPFFDVDFLFIALRGLSIGDKIELQFTCNAVIDDNNCGFVYEDNLDLSKCRMVKDESISNNIDLGSALSMKMKYPTYALMKQMEAGEAIIDRKIKVIANCIDMIVKGDEIHTTKDLSKKELMEFVEELSEFQFRKLEMFVDNFPYFVVDIENTCPKCKTLHRKEYRDFSAFFQ